MKSIFKKVARPFISSALILLISMFGFLHNPVFAESDTVKYTYDESGNRIMKEENGKKTYYVNRYYEEDSDGTTRKFVYANGVKVSTITTHPDKSVSTVYHHSDHLGGSNVSTDTSGKVVEVNDYFPYGSSRIEERTGGYENNKLYTGKELDRNTGLYYYGARYYDPLIGRFTSVDPWGGDITDPQSLNKYSYVRNNPLKYVDPTGEAIGLPALMWVGSLIGAFIGTYQNVASTDTNSPAIHTRSEGEIITSMATGEIAGGAIGGVAGFVGGKIIKSVAKPVGKAIKQVGTKIVSGVKGGLAKFKLKTVKELRKFRSLVAKGLGMDDAAKAAKGTNKYGATPDGRPFTEHYGAEKGPIRNMPGSVIDNTIKEGRKFDAGSGKTGYYDSKNNVTVITGDGGSIVSSRKGKPRSGQ